MPDDLITMIAEDNAAQTPQGGEEPVIPPVEPQKPVTPTEPKTPLEGEPVKYSPSDFGQYQTADEIKERLKLAEQFEQITPEHEGLKTKYSELETQFNELKTKPRHKNAVYERLEIVEETRPGDLDLFKEVVFSKPDPVKLVTLDLIKKYPSLKDDKEALDRKLTRMYPGMFGEDVDRESNEYKDAYLDLRLDSENILNQYKKEFDGITLPEAPKPPDPKVHQEFVNGWNQQLTKELKTVGKLSVEVLSEDGKSTEPLFDIDPGDATKYLDLAMNFVQDNKLERTKENIAEVKDMAKRLWILDNLDAYNTEIAKHVANKIGKEKDANWRKKVHNPEPPKNQQPAKPSVITQEQNEESIVALTQ